MGPVFIFTKLFCAVVGSIAGLILAVYTSPYGLEPLVAGIGFVGGAFAALYMRRLITKDNSKLW